MKGRGAHGVNRGKAALDYSQGDDPAHAWFLPVESLYLQLVPVTIRSRKHWATWALALRPAIGSF